MRPVLFSIGKYNIYSWGFMLALAVIAAVLGTGRLFERQGYKREWAMDLIIIMVLCGLAGSYLLYFFTYDWSLFWNSPREYFALHRGGIRGLVWYGGFAGALLAMFIYLRWRKLPFWKVADIFAPFTALGYAMVRVGCFMAGCCYGVVTNSPLGVVFPAVDNLPRYPTQLFSSAANLAIFIFLIWFYRRRRFEGQVACLYLLLYPVYRFCIEFIREPESMWGPISSAQGYSLIMFAAGVGLYIWLRRRARSSQEENRE